MAAWQPPDVLVLGGGGILGEAWMTSLLVGVEQETGFDPRACRAFVGTSAGSIVGAVLAAGVEPRTRLGHLPEPPPLIDETPTGDRPGVLSQAWETALGVGGVAVAPLVAVGLRSSEPAGALARRVFLGRIPEGRLSLDRLARDLDQAGARWDGRLSVAAVDAESGRRVMFGSDGAPEASVSAAVTASCAIPGVFEPRTIDGRRYVDGGLWSPTNMDRAPAGRGTRVLCLNPTGSMRPSAGSPFGMFGSLSRGLASIEALALKRRGARVTTVGPDAASHAAMGDDLMDPTPRSSVIVAGLAQGRALAS
jgi:NTE family protein